jgi:hypothetical protein
VDDKSILLELRKANTILTAIFTVSVGALFILVSILSFYLHSEIGLKLVVDEEMNSRMPVINMAFEQIKFRGSFLVSSQDNSDVHYRYLRPHIELAMTRNKQARN